MNDLLYTVPETAKLLKVNNNKIYELIKAGLLTPLKLGRYKIPRNELEQFIKDYTGKDLNDLNNIKEV